MHPSPLGKPLPLGHGRLLALALGLYVSLKLLGVSEHVVVPLVEPLAVRGLVVAAEVETVIVYRAEVVIVKVLARALYEQVPSPVPDVHGDSIIVDLPHETFEVVVGAGLLDIDREVVAARGRTVPACGKRGVLYTGGFQLGSGVFLCFGFLSFWLTFRHLSP